MKSLLSIAFIALFIFIGATVLLKQDQKIFANTTKGFTPENNQIERFLDIEGFSKTDIDHILNLPRTLEIDYATGQVLTPKVFYPSADLLSGAVVSYDSPNVYTIDVVYTFANRSLKK